MNSYLLQLLLLALLANSAFTKVTSREDTGHFAADDEHHDNTFDQAAFLGEQKAKEFSKLDRKESGERLRAMIGKIDLDKDGKINASELKQWIKDVAERSQRSVTSESWKRNSPNENAKTLKWEEYSEKNYGPESARIEDYEKAIKNDKRRWERADIDKDGELSLDEFHAFLHPQDTPHMLLVVTEELLEAVDADGDGFVSEDEYISDVARAYSDSWKQGQAEPEWVSRERAQFKSYRDSDGDGKMNRAEVGEWITPKDYDPIDAEVEHLFHHADADHDHQLTMEEIMNQQDLFVSSEATHYGEELHHQEL